MRAPRGTAAVGLVLLALAGCTAYRQLIGSDTVSLEKAEVLRMDVDIRRPVKAICPREPVQMWVTVDARLPDQSSVSRLETWEGSPKVRRNGKLDFGNFEFTSGQGTFDEFGFFRPVGDMMPSVEGGFTLRTALRSRPDRFSETRGYPPDYSCIRSAGGAGQPGVPGRTGSDGHNGYVIHEAVDGQPGGPGDPGAPGGPGGQGPRIQAFATYVRTRFYPRLIAIRVEGEVRDLVLAVPEQPFVVAAVGGAGRPRRGRGQGRQRRRRWAWATRPERSVGRLRGPWRHRGLRRRRRSGRGRRGGLRRPFPRPGPAAAARRLRRARLAGRPRRLGRERWRRRLRGPGRRSPGAGWPRWLGRQRGLRRPPGFDWHGAAQARRRHRPLPGPPGHPAAVRRMRQD